MIKVGGIVPFTTIDYPEKLATVLFCQGCPLNCPYCHNQDLKSFNDAKDDASFDEVLDFLIKRKKLVDAVVLSGGEPLFQPKLKNAIEVIKEKGFKIALHTSGANFKIFDEVYGLIDYVAMDFKVPFEDYDVIYKGKEDILKSLIKIAKGKVDYEIRTTLDPNLLNKDKVLSMAKFLHEKGIKNYALQLCRATDDYKFDKEKAHSFFIDDEFLNKIREFFPNIVLRK